MIREIKNGESVTEYDLIWNPQVLYHYTNREGLLGILSKGHIWASNIKYLNDASEFIYAREFFTDKLTGIRNRIGKEPHISILDNAIKLIRNYNSSVFSFSLSKNGDQLSQWRSYCSPSNGYAIGFNAPLLHKRISKIQNARFQPVSYTENQQWEIFNQIEASVVRKYRDSKNNILSRALFREFIKIAPFLKDYSFSEEDEWRIVINLRSSANKNILYRASKSLLVPYIPINILSKKTIPVCKIIIGPSPHPELEKEAVMNLCHKYGIQADIFNSEIPYRSW